MASLCTSAALLCAAVNLLAGGVGSWLWWQVETGRAVWPLVRAGQVCAVLLGLAAGAALVAGAKPDSGLFWLYAVLPIAVSFIAEQLRIASAETVLDARGLEDAQALGGLPEREQRSVVLSIVRREMGVMALAALVMCFLAVRAAMTTAGL